LDFEVFLDFEVWILDFGFWILDFGVWVGCALTLHFPPVSDKLAGMQAKKLLHTRYRVNDLNRTVKFYKEVLGLSELRRQKSPRGSELVFLKAPQSQELIELCSFPGSGPVQVQPDLTHLAFEVDSLDEFAKHLASLGLKYSDGPTRRPGGGGFAFIDAPEGYEIELIQMGKARNADSPGRRRSE